MSFYVTDLVDLSRRWPIILKGKHILHSDDKFFDIPFTPSYVTQAPTSYEEVDRDDVHAIWNDHQEGIWEN